MLDPFTYGNSLAAIRLAEISDNKHESKIVGAFLSKSHRVLKQIGHIPSRADRLFLCQIFRDRQLEMLADLNITPACKSYARNVFVTNYKKIFLEYAKADK